MYQKNYEWCINDAIAAKCTFVAPVMKSIFRAAILFACIYILACTACGSNTGYKMPEDAMDAAREYIGACMQGDFDKASFYALPDDANRARIALVERSYRERDKEGRQQLRNASINIIEMKNNGSDAAELVYRISSEKHTHTLPVKRVNGEWKVDAAKEN